MRTEGAGEVRFCTIAGSRTAAYARSLSDRIAEYYRAPLLIAEPEDGRDDGPQVPRLLQRLLGEDSSPLVYLDATYELTGRPESLEKQLDSEPVAVRGESLVALVPSKEADDFLGAWIEQGERPTATATVDDPALVDMAALHPLERYVVNAGGRGRWLDREDDLRELVADYQARLIERGWADDARWEDVGHKLANGVLFDERLLILHAQARAEGEDFGDIFSDAGTQAFVTWLKAPPRAGVPIPRLLADVYAERDDLVTAYPYAAAPTAAPDPQPLDDLTGFIGWAWAYGRAEHELADELLPPPPPHLDLEPLARHTPSVEVVGFLTGTLGLGEAARLYFEALRAGGVPVSTRAVDVDSIKKRKAPAPSEYGRVAFGGVAGTAPAEVNLICINAPELPRLADRLGDPLVESRCNIGVWAWETDVIPRWWDSAFSYLDEIWVYSRYVAENLGRVSPVPVVTIPPPTVAPGIEEQEPDLGLPEGFRFLFMLDLNSTLQRKNPLGVIEAFKQAFAPGEGPHLVIKTIHAHDRPADYERLRAAGEGREDILVVDSSLTEAEKHALLASCDCYVSLHRSEGYGLPLAECMAMGKPVIATGFSGNLDFMTVGNSYLVDYRLARVGLGVEIYPAHGMWAEPDLDDAAAQMRSVWGDQDQARERGARAREDVLANLSPERVGEMARARLDRIGDERLVGRRRAPEPPEPEVHEERPDPETVRPGAISRARAAARRLRR